MPATLHYSSASALTESWVRTFVDWIVWTASTQRMSTTLSAEDRALAADIAASVHGDGHAYARIIGRYQAHDRAVNGSIYA